MTACHAKSNGTKRKTDVTFEKKILVESHKRRLPSAIRQKTVDVDFPSRGTGIFPPVNL